MYNKVCGEMFFQKTNGLIVACNALFSWVFCHYTPYSAILFPNIAGD